MLRKCIGEKERVVAKEKKQEVGSFGGGKGAIGQIGHD